MTDRIHALTVFLTKPMRTDDAETLIEAIKLLRGVGRVDTHIHGSAEAMMYEEARIDIAKKLWDALNPPKESKS